MLVRRFLRRQIPAYVDGRINIVGVGDVARGHLLADERGVIADRVWRSRAQLKLATVEYIGWFNTARLHSALRYHTPAEHEAASSTARAQALLAQAAPTARQLPTLAGGLSDR